MNMRLNKPQMKEQSKMLTFHYDIMEKQKTRKGALEGTLGRSLVFVPNRVKVELNLPLVYVNNLTFYQSIHV